MALALADGSVTGRPDLSTSALPPLKAPELDLCIRSADLEIDFVLTVKLKENRANTLRSLLAELTKAVEEGQSLDMKDAVAAKLFDVNLKRCLERRHEQLQFYSEVVKNCDQLANMVGNLKRDYFLELNNLRSQLSSLKRNPHKEPDDITFFAPGSYKIPDWKEIVEDLDERRRKREEEMYRHHDGAPRQEFFAVKMHCQTCRRHLATGVPEAALALCDESDGTKSGVLQMSRWTQTDDSAEAKPSQSCQTDDVFCVSRCSQTLEAQRSNASVQTSLRSVEIAEKEARILVTSHLERRRQKQQQKREDEAQQKKDRVYQEELTRQLELLEEHRQKLHEQQLCLKIQLQKQDEKDRKQKELEEKLEENLERERHTRKQLEKDWQLQQELQQEVQQELQEKLQKRQNELMDLKLKLKQRTRSGLSLEGQRSLGVKILERRLTAFQAHLKRSALAKIHSHAVSGCLLAWSSASSHGAMAGAKETKSAPQSICLAIPYTPTSLRGRSPELVSRSSEPRMSLRCCSRSPSKSPSSSQGKSDNPEFMENEIGDSPEFIGNEIGDEAPHGCFFMTSMEADSNIPLKPLRSPRGVRTSVRCWRPTGLTLCGNATTIVDKPLAAARSKSKDAPGSVVGDSIIGRSCSGVGAPAGSGGALGMSASAVLPKIVPDPASPRVEQGGGGVPKVQVYPALLGKSHAQNRLQVPKQPNIAGLKISSEQ